MTANTVHRPGRRRGRRDRDRPAPRAPPARAGATPALSNSMTPVLRRLCAVAVAAALALFAIAGCGGGDPPPPGTPSAADDLVTPRRRRRATRRDRPKRALLQWWMNIQYNDLDGYLQRPRGPDLRRSAKPKPGPGTICCSSPATRSARSRRSKTASARAGTATLYHAGSRPASRSVPPASPPAARRRPSPWSAKAASGRSLTTATCSTAQHDHQRSGRKR